MASSTATTVTSGSARRSGRLATWLRCGPRRQACWLVTARTVSAGGASFPEPGAARPVVARITVHAPGLAAVTRIADMALAHNTVLPMPDGRFLVAGARCRWRRDGPDRNAVLYSADGQVFSEHVLGDGIRHVLATGTGQVWVGVFDDGIYGNYGWGQPDSQEPAGAYGIVRFSPGLATRLALPPIHRGRPVGRDQRPLNVDDTCAWACYDPDFLAVWSGNGPGRSPASKAALVGAIERSVASSEACRVVTAGPRTSHDLTTDHRQYLAGAGDGKSAKATVTDLMTRAGHRQPSRCTSSGLVSACSPRQLGCRMLPSPGPFGDAAWHGSTQCAPRAYRAGTGVLNGLVSRSSGASRRIRPASMAREPGARRPGIPQLVTVADTQYQRPDHVRAAP